MPSILLALAILFGYLAYDARKLSVPAKDVPYSVTAAGLGQDVSSVPLPEQEKRKSWNVRYGLGDLKINLCGCGAFSRWPAPLELWWSLPGEPL